MRRVPQTAEVEELVARCREAKRWLTGPGAFADPGAFQAMRDTYFALIRAIQLLPRGPQLLKDARALPKARKEPKTPDTERLPASFSMDELVLLKKAILTPEGWLAPAPLVPHVDAIKARHAAENPDAEMWTDKKALEEILKGAGRSDWRARQEVKAWQVELSRLRKIDSKRDTSAGVSEGAPLVPPKGG